MGQFAGSLWGSLSRNQKQALVFLVVIAGIPLGGTAYQKLVHVFHEELVYVAAPRAYAEMLQVNTVEEMKADVLDRLSKCESGGNSDVGIVFDSNGKASIGVFQWQIASFQHYWFKKNGEKLSNKDAIVYALDEDKARDLASWVIFETNKGSGSDWVNCTNWHDLDALVDFIKSHE
jgi:hypothetical protein